MVNVHSQNPPANLADVPLRPSNSSSSRYLASHVGQVLTATVVQTKEIPAASPQPPATNTGPNTSEAPTAAETRAKTLDSILAATTSNAQKPLSSHSTAGQNNINPALQSAAGQQIGQNSTQYNVTLNINGTLITVQSPLAPRLGQLIDLEILTSQQLKT